MSIPFLGWSLGQHGEFAKYSNFEEATRVPLLISVPHLSEKKIVCDNLVELVDIFPTLVDLTQVAEPLKICSNQTSLLVCTEGLSLVPTMIDNIQNKVCMYGVLAQILQATLYMCMYAFKFVCRFL